MVQLNTNTALNALIGFLNPEQLAANRERERLEREAQQKQAMLEAEMGRQAQKDNFTQNTALRELAIMEDTFGLKKQAAQSDLQRQSALQQLAEQFASGEINQEEALKRQAVITGDISKSIRPRDAGGATGILVDRLMAENPSLSFADALATVQSGVRRGYTMQNGMAVPIEGLPSALGQLAQGETLGELQAQLQLKPKIAQEVAQAEMEGAGKISEREKLAREMATAKRVGKFSLKSAFDKSENINNQIDKAVKQVTTSATGLTGQAFQNVWGSDSANLKATLNTIGADSAFTSLQEMRDNSPTGGALGQVTERELDLLRDALVAISQSQSPEMLKENLETYKQLRQQSLQRAAQAYKEEFGEIPEGLENLINPQKQAIDLNSLTPQQLQELDDDTLKALLNGSN